MADIFYFTVSSKKLCKTKQIDQFFLLKTKQISLLSLQDLQLFLSNRSHLFRSSQIPCICYSNNLEMATDLTVNNLCKFLQGSSKTNKKLQKLKFQIAYLVAADLHQHVATAGDNYQPYRPIVFVLGLPLQFARVFVCFEIPKYL